MTEPTDDELRLQIEQAKTCLENNLFVAKDTERSLVTLKADADRLIKDISDLEMALRLRQASIDEPAAMKELCPEG